MSKERIDTLFRQGLEDHRTPPPADLWDRLEGELSDEKEGEKRKGLVLWYRVAAAVLLLMVAGWWWLRQPNPGSQEELVAQTEENGSVEDQSFASGEDEEVQNLALATGEDEEVQNRVAASGENEEVQNSPLMLASGEDEEVQNVPVLAATGEDEEVQNLSLAEPMNAHTAVATLTTTRPDLLPLAGQAPAGVQLSMAGLAEANIETVELKEPPLNLLLMPELDVEEGFDKAVALAHDMKEGDVTMADIREAKSSLGSEGLSLAALRDAKNEFLRFQWIDD